MYLQITLDCLIFKNIYSFIYFWLCWVFGAASGLAQVMEGEGYSLAGRAVGHMRSVVTSSTTLEHADLSCCGKWA